MHISCQISPCFATRCLLVTALVNESRIIRTQTGTYNRNGRSVLGITESWRIVPVCSLRQIFYSDHIKERKTVKACNMDGRMKNDLHTKS
jgi:hypothetical protein